MLETMIKEINRCMDNNCPISALSMALIIPDMCGKAEYPECEKNKKRYVDWFDEWIGKYETYEGNEMPHLSGELVYSLRCSMFHEGKPTINKGKFNLAKFSLFWSTKKDSFVFGGSSMAEVVDEKEGKRKLENIVYEVNIRNLIFKICTCAEAYYKENKEKFNFLNYTIKNIDRLP